MNNNHNQAKLKTPEDKEFEKYLERIEDPKNEREVNRNLPANPTVLQVAKYKLCKKILAYQIKNNLTDEELNRRMELSQAETEDILFCEIERFTLDRLMVYASRLFSPNELEVVVEEKNAADARATA
jgi:predicted XRE-type DNA-binding protein